MMDEQAKVTDGCRDGCRDEQIHKWMDEWRVDG